MTVQTRMFPIRKVRRRSTRGAEAGAGLKAQERGSPGPGLEKSGGTEVGLGTERGAEVGIADGAEVGRGAGTGGEAGAGIGDGAGAAAGARGGAERGPGPTPDQSHGTRAAIIPPNAALILTMMWR